MRENVYVLPMKEFFHLQFKRNEAAVFCYDQHSGQFGEFSPYVTLSSASTVGLINIAYEANNALLSYQSAKFFVFSIYITVQTEEGLPRPFSLRAITSEKHGLMFFEVANSMRPGNNNRLEVRREMAKNTVLFLMIHTTNGKFTMNVGRAAAQQKSSIEWSSENGWSIPNELDGEKLAINVI